MKKLFLAVLAAFAATQINGTTNVPAVSTTKTDNPHGLKEWNVDGLVVYAATKNKANKLAARLRAGMQA